MLDVAGLLFFTRGVPAGNPHKTGFFALSGGFDPQVGFDNCDQLGDFRILRVVKIQLACWVGDDVVDCSVSDGLRLALDPVGVNFVALNPSYLPLFLGLCNLLTGFAT